MNCNYIIQLPGGGEILIPANFGTIENTPEITSKLESLDREADNFLEVVSDIVNDLHDLTGRTILDKNTISDIVTNNVDNVSEIIPIINSIVENNSEFNNLSKAVKLHLTNNLNSDTVEQLKETLSTPVTREYFNRSSFSGVFNTSSIEMEHLKIKSLISEVNVSGFRSEYLTSFYRFLQSISKANPDLYKEYTLFSSDSQLGLKSINANKLNFFKEGDLDTLFLSLSKRIGSSIDVEIINDIMESNYKRSEDFFNQRLSKLKDIKNSPYENLLMSEDTKDKTKINRLISEISKKLNGNSNLERDLKSLVINLNKVLFSEEYQNKISLEEALSSANTLFSKEYRNLKYSKILDLIDENIGENYSEYKTLNSPDNLFKEASSKIAIGQDLIKMNYEGRTVGALVTDIYIREKQGRITGVNIRGIIKTSEGILVEIAQDFNNGNSIEYKNKENPKLIYQEEFLKNDFSLSLNKKVSQEVAKFLLNGGDTVNSNYVVSGIYPEYIVAKVGEDLVSIPYSQINHIKSSTLYDLSNKLNEVLNLPLSSDTNLIIKGDFVKIENNYHPVIDVNGDKITLASFSNNKVTTLEIDKSKVSEVRINNIEKFTAAEEYKLSRNLNTISIDSTMSKFNSSDKVFTGDFGTGTIEGEHIQFKVLDNVSKRVVTNTGLYLSYEAIQDVEFYTERDISSKTALENIKNNSILISVKDSSKITGKTFVELRYIVPKGTDLKKLFLLPNNNYANIGYFQEAKGKIGKGEIDATDTMLQLLKKNNHKGDKIYGEKENIGKSNLKRNINNYRKVNKFSDLSSESKEALNVLKSGTYFSVYTTSSIDQKIYRIIENKEGVVTAQYNTINSNGDIITIEKEFLAENLLNSKQIGDTNYPEGSIANLYLHYKNKNLKSVINAANENMTSETIRTQHSINELSQKMGKTFNQIGVAIEHSSEVFSNGQHAKVHSDENGKVSIVLNTKTGTFSDLIHETLHIYLTLLRYTDVNAYGRLIDSVVNENLEGYVNDMNVYDKEEAFVKAVVLFSKGSTDFLYNDLKSFMTELTSVVNLLVKDSTGEDLDLDMSELINNPLDFLNTSLGKLYGINPTENSHEFYNVGLLSFEPMFRNWLKNNNIILNCK